jgi:hypothetical protein
VVDISRGTVKNLVESVKFVTMQRFVVHSLVKVRTSSGVDLEHGRKP